MINNERELFSTSSIFSFSVNLLSLELTYFCSGLLFAAVVRRRVWDYAVTVTLVHVMITSLGEQKSNNTSTHVRTQMTEHVAKLNICFPVAVMLEFPMVWQWWLALGNSSVRSCI